MTDLRQLYRQAVVGRMAELQAALREAQSGVMASDDTLRRIAHSLRGSGATYGFPEVTEAAGQLEDAHTGDLEQRAQQLMVVLRGVIEGGPKPRRVLIVDDDPEILLLLRTVLAVEGRELTTAENGYEASAQLDKGNFSLIILDLLLPDVDGQDILKRIRADARYANTPVVVLSAKTTTTTRRECEELGATAFFEKPFDPEAVAAAVAAQIQRASDAEDDGPA
jgi:CheY-like chemotaxis protein/HPt (histidine-containing phosphotransfer) domain-containing protein